MDLLNFGYEHSNIVYLEIRAQRIVDDDDSFDY